MKDRTFRIGDSINKQKKNKPGKALCSLCIVVTYGGRGNFILKYHINTEAQIKSVETKRDYYFTGKKDKLFPLKK